MSIPSMLRDLEYYRDYRLEAGEIDLGSYLLDEENLTEKIASGFYPTPTVLADLQRTQGQEPRDPDATDAEPFPSRRLKTEIFDLAKYAEKDDYVKSLRPEPFESDVDFAVRLFQQGSSNLDSVRAAFCFVCSVPLDELPRAVGETEFYTRVREMRQIGETAEVFDWLIGLTSVPSKKIVGYKKGAGYESGMEVRRSDGNWTACYVEGEWRLVDALWGAQMLSGFDTGNYAKLDGECNVENAQQSGGQLIHGCNEFYFLTDPQNLILTHLPVEDMSQWQMLVRTLTLAEFHRMPNYFSGSLEDMFHYSVNPASHPLNVILGQPGNINVYLKEAAGQTYDYQAEISIHKSSINDGTRAEIKEHSAVSGYLSKMTRMGDDSVRFKFVPPCSGKFMLSINLLRTSEYPDMIEQEGIEYVVHCPRADRSAEMLPVGCADLTYFGAGAELAAAHLKTEEPGEIKVDDGERLIQLESTDQHRRHRLECQLYGTANKSLSPKNLLTWTIGPKIRIQFLSPDSGSFALVIWDGDVPVFQILLDSDSEFRDSRDFPLPDLDSLGGLDVADEALRVLIHPLSHPDPYICCEEPSLELKFSATIRLEIRAELFHTGADGRNEELSGYTFINRNDEGFNVDVRFKTAGHYILKLLYRRGSSEPWRHYLNYFIRCVGLIDGRVEQFPKVQPAWKCDNVLVRPKQKLLPLNEPVTVRVQIRDPEFNVAYLLNESKNERTMMQRDDENIWQGSIEGFDDSAGSSVKLFGGPSANKCNELLSYQFESPNDHTIRNMEIRSAAKLNLSRLGNERLRKRKQVNHERKEKALEPLPDVPLEECSESQFEYELKNLLLQNEPTLEDVQAVLPDDEPTLEDVQAVPPDDEPTLVGLVEEEASSQTITQTNNETEESPEPEKARDEAPDQQSVGEEAAIADWLNKNLRSDPDCQKYLPMVESVKQATAADSQKLKAMFPETGDQTDIRGATPEQILMQWVNYQLKNAGSRRTIENFSQDVSDGEVYADLLQQITPPEVRDCIHPAAKIVSQKDLLLRAQLVLQNAEFLDAREFLQPADIVNGNSKLNMAFVANLFKRFPTLPEPQLPEGGKPVEKQAAAAKLPETIREEKTYTNFMNSAGVEPPINCLYTDVRSGLQYLQLLDQIQPGLVQWSRVNQAFHGVRANFQRLENCNYVVELGRQLGFSLVGSGGEDLLMGNETVMLSILRQLVMAHTPAALAKAHSDSGESISRVEKSKRLIDERAIVEWTNQQLQRGGKESQLYSFHDSALGDCHCLLDLIDCLRPGSVDYNFVLPGANEAERLQNARLAISLCWRAGVKVFTSPVDVAEVRPRMVMSVFAALMQLSFQTDGSATVGRSSSRRGGGD